MRLQLVTVLVIIGALQSDSAILENGLQADIHINNAFLRTLQNMLAEECPSYIPTRREVISVNHPITVEVQKKIYSQMMEKLIQCRDGQTTTNVQTTPATTTTQTTAVKQGTTNEMTTTTMPLPQECRQAINYTQSWRRDHSGSDIRPGGPNSKSGWACDYHIDSPQWFRFTGDAGNRILNRCPVANSCGTHNAMWTNAVMPQKVGVETAIQAYGAQRGSCRYVYVKLHVMRCSWDTDHDLIYINKAVSNKQSTCDQAFCGMM